MRTVSVFCVQAAAEYAKTRLPVVLRQQLQRYEKQKENSALTHKSILKQQILNMDKEILEKLSASYDEAGERSQYNTVQMYVYNN